MRTTNRTLLIALATLAAAPLAAQNEKAATPDSTPQQQPTPAVAAVSVVVGSPAAGRIGQFEAPKQSNEFNGLQLQIGGAFAQTFQALDHSNTAAPRLDPLTGADLNQLSDIRPGVNLPAANLNLGVQLAPGINLALESYMSSRHHNEFWVKGGYATIDASPINHPLLVGLMEHVTIRAGMYEPNYGDAIFRRSDGGYTINNPFAENLLLDAFTTEPGADVMVRMGDAFVMGGLTTGQNKGDVKDGPVAANPAYLAKAGYDRQVTDALRVRLSGSMYTNNSSPAGTLYAGDRTGSNYWGVVDNSTAAAFTNGRLNPGYKNQTRAFQLNPFVKFGGLELFGVLERASGRAANETETRDVSQYAGDLVYRFLSDRLYVAGRYNVVRGDFSALSRDVSVNRQALAAGWFISPTMLTKIEYVQQSYEGFDASDIQSGAEFSGVVIQGALAF